MDRVPAIDRRAHRGRAIEHADERIGHEMREDPRPGPGQPQPAGKCYLDVRLPAGATRSGVAVGDAGGTDSDGAADALGLGEGLAALEMTLERLGFPVKRGAAVAAAEGVFQEGATS